MYLISFRDLHKVSVIRDGAPSRSDDHYDTKLIGNHIDGIVPVEHLLYDNSREQVTACLYFLLTVNTALRSKML